MVPKGNSKGLEVNLMFYCQHWVKSVSLKLTYILNLSYYITTKPAHLEFDIGRPKQETQSTMLHKTEF